MFASIAIFAIARRLAKQKAIGSILGVCTAMYSTGMAVGGNMDSLLYDRLDGCNAAFVLS